jgi:BolA family transcriptional regulator, general stress-responsive regulator
MTDIPQMHHPGAGQSRAERLEATLRRVFAPSLVRVFDHSAEHVGHAGARPEGETHYSVVVVSEQFRGMSRLARSRAVHQALTHEFTDGMHALSLTLRTREEQARFEQNTRERE